MNIILVVATLAMLAILITVIVRGWNPTFAMLGIGTLAIVIMAIVNFDPAASTTGSAVFDGLNTLTDLCISNFQTFIFTICVVMGYVAYLDSMKANDYFATCIASSLKGIKNKYILMSLALIFGILVKWIVPSDAGALMLTLGTVYPVLRKLGCSRVDSVMALLVPASWPMGPNNFFTGMLFGGYSNMPEITAPMWFINYELRYIIPVAAVVIVAFLISTSFFDKHAKPETEASDEDLSLRSPKDFGLPFYYAVFPALPLVLVLLFGGILIPSISAGIIPIYFSAVAIVLIVRIIEKKCNIKEVSMEFNAFCAGLGNAFGVYGTLCLAGSVFAEGLGSVGGMTILMNYVVEKTSVSGVALVVLLCVVAFVVGALSGNLGVPFFPIAAIIGGLIGSGYVDANLAWTVFPPVTIMGTGLSLSTACTLIAAEKAKVPATTFVVRLIAPLTLGAIAVLVFNILTIT